MDLNMKRQTILGTRLSNYHTHSTFLKMTEVEIAYMTSVFRILTVLSISLLAACGAPTKEALIQKYGGAESVFIEVDGNQVHYRDEGRIEGGRGTVVLLHGTASSLHTWDDWVQSLSQDYRVIRMDLPGFGLTGPDPSDRYEVVDDVAFLNKFLARVVEGPIHLVGSSLGGRIAWDYSLAYPAAVESLTLMNALGYPQEKWPLPIELAQWPILDSVFASMSPRVFFSSSLKEIYFDDGLVNDELIDRYHGLANYPGNLDAFPKRVKAKLDTESDRIQMISTPTLVMWGEEDIYFPVKNAYRFQQDIRGAALKVYENTGHLPMEEIPKKSVRDYQLFLAGLSRTNTS